jgi:hypothetical protein
MSVLLRSGSGTPQYGPPFDRAKPCMACLDHLWQSRHGEELRADRRDGWTSSYVVKHGRPPVRRVGPYLLDPPQLAHVHGTVLSGHADPHGSTGRHEGLEQRLTR